MATNQGLYLFKKKKNKKIKCQIIKFSKANEEIP